MVIFQERISIFNRKTRFDSRKKIVYLKRVVKGTAANKIKNMITTAGNYQRAWSILEKAYADENLIISKHLSGLLRLPIQTKAEGVTKLADDTLHHVESTIYVGNRGNRRDSSAKS